MTQQDSAKADAALQPKMAARAELIAEESIAATAGLVRHARRHALSCQVAPPAAARHAHSGCVCPPPPVHRICMHVHFQTTAANSMAELIAELKLMVALQDSAE